MDTVGGPGEELNERRSWEQGSPCALLPSVGSPGVWRQSGGRRTNNCPDMACGIGRRRWSCEGAREPRLGVGVARARPPPSDSNPLPVIASSPASELILGYTSQTPSDLACAMNAINPQAHRCRCSPSTVHPNHATTFTWGQTVSYCYCRTFFTDLLLTYRRSKALIH